MGFGKKRPTAQLQDRRLYVYCTNGTSVQQSRSNASSRDGGANVHQKLHQVYKVAEISVGENWRRQKRV